MKVFVTGVVGQLGHDVMNELHKRGYKGIDSDFYCGVANDTAVTEMPCIRLDITDAKAVNTVITEIHPKAGICYTAWTSVDMAEEDDKVKLVHAINVDGAPNIANIPRF